MLIIDRRFGPWLLIKGRDALVSKGSQRRSDRSAVGRDIDRQALIERGDVVINGPIGIINDLLVAGGTDQNALVDTTIRLIERPIGKVNPSAAARDLDWRALLKVDSLEIDRSTRRIIDLAVAACIDPIAITDTSILVIEKPLGKIDGPAGSGGVKLQAQFERGDISVKGLP